MQGLFETTNMKSLELKDQAVRSVTCSEGYDRKWCVGDIVRRYRFCGEIMEAVKGAVGNDCPLFIKTSPNDCFDVGLMLAESLHVARRLVEDGIDCTEVNADSGASASGMAPSRTNILKEQDQAYLGNLAKQFKGELRVPVATVGGIRSPTVVSRILAESVADYVAMRRPLILEPHLINRWKKKDLKRSKRIWRSGCFETVKEGLGVVSKVDRDLKVKRQKQ